MEWQLIVALALAVPIVMLPVALIWYLNVGGLAAALRRGRVRAPAAVVAVGKPVGKALRLASPVMVYGFLIWVVLAKFGWQMALVVGVVMPIIAVPAALVWYMNVSGLYRVIMDTRRRDRRRAAARKEAHATVRS